MGELLATKIVANACINVWRHLDWAPMAYRFFQVPVHDCGGFGEGLNRFLRGHRVLSVDRRWVDAGTESYWSFCVDYLEPATASGPLARAAGESRGKVDYREVLPPEEFAAFVKLRALREAISKEAGVPVYVIFTNEQLAAMIQKGAASKADLGRIDGIGEARIQKYFDSIDHAILCGRLERKFKDRRLLDLFGRIIASYEVAPGHRVPIGSLTSQHLASFYLGWLDRFVKEKRRAVGYMR